MIREFSDNDFEVISAIYNTSKLDELLYEEDIFELLPLKKDIQRLKSLKESTIYVYEVNVVVGYASYKGNEISSLFVHPDSRGSGIGKKLMAFLLGKIGRIANLYVANSNRPAIEFYEKMGFCISNEFQTTYNGKPVLANEMVRALDS